MMQLRCEELKVEDLFNTGSVFDPQTPALTIKIGNRLFHTERSKDGGVNATYSEVFLIAMTREEYENLSMGVEVHNVKLLGQKKHIGAATAQLSVLIPKFNEPTNVVIDLMHEGKVQQGRVRMTCTVITDSESATIQDVPKVPMLQKATSQEMENSKEDVTVASNGISKDQIKSATKIMDSDSTTVSEAQIPISDAEQAVSSQSTDLKDETANIHQTERAGNFLPLSIEEKTALLYLRLSSFALYDLLAPESSRGDLSQIGLKVSLGDFTTRLEMREDSTLEAFVPVEDPDTIDLIIPVTEYDKMKLELEIEIFQSLSGLDTLICRGAKKVTSLFHALDQTNSIQIDLWRQTAEQKGSISFKGIASLLSIRLPMELEVLDICCRELKNVDFIGAQDLYVTLRFAEREYRTEVMENAGEAVDYLGVGYLWDNISGEMLQKEKLEVAVFDRGVLRGDRMVGSASYDFSVLLNHVREDRFLKIPLSISLPERKGSMGRVELKMRLRLQEEGKEVKKDLPVQEEVKKEPEALSLSLTTTTVAASGTDLMFNIKNTSTADSLRLMQGNERGRNEEVEDSSSLKLPSLVPLPSSAAAAGTGMINPELTPLSLPPINSARSIGNK